MRLYKYTWIKIIVRKFKYLQMDQKTLIQDIQQLQYAFPFLKSQPLRTYSYCVLSSLLSGKSTSRQDNYMIFYKACSKIFNVE